MSEEIMEYSRWCANHKVWSHFHVYHEKKENMSAFYTSLPVLLPFTNNISL